MTSEDKPTVLWKRITDALKERNALTQGSPEVVAEHARRVLGTVLVERFLRKYYLQRKSGISNAQISDVDAEVLVQELEALPYSGVADWKKQTTDTSFPKATDSLLRVPTNPEEAEAYGREDRAVPRPMTFAWIWLFFSGFAFQKPGDDMESQPLSTHSTRRVLAVAGLSLLILTSVSVAAFLNYRRHHMLSSQYKQKAHRALHLLECVRKKMGSDSYEVDRQMLQIEADQAVSQARFSISTEPDAALHFRLAELSLLLSFCSADLLSWEQETQRAHWPRTPKKHAGKLQRDFDAFDACDRAAQFFVEHGQESPYDKSDCTNKSNFSDRSRADFEH